MGHREVRGRHHRRSRHGVTWIPRRSGTRRAAPIGNRRIAADCPGYRRRRSGSPRSTSPLRTRRDAPSIACTSIRSPTSGGGTGRPVRSIGRVTPAGGSWHIGSRRVHSRSFVRRRWSRRATVDRATPRRSFSASSGGVDLGAGSATPLTRSRFARAAQGARAPSNATSRPASALCSRQSERRREPESHI